MSLGDQFEVEITEDEDINRWRIEAKAAFAWVEDPSWLPWGGEILLDEFMQRHQLAEAQLEASKKKTDVEQGVAEARASAAARTVEMKKELDAARALWSAKTISMEEMLVRTELIEKKYADAEDTVDESAEVEVTVTPRPKPRRKPGRAVEKAVERQDTTGDDIEILRSESNSLDDVEMRDASPSPAPGKDQKRKRASPTLSVRDYSVCLQTSRNIELTLKDA